MYKYPTVTRRALVQSWQATQEDFPGDQTSAALTNPAPD